MTKIFSTLLLLSFVVQVSAQEKLEKTEAIQKVLLNNFDIKVSRNDIKIAENNASFLNSGYLPTLTGTAGITYNTDNVEATFANGEVVGADNAKSDSRNANLTLNFVLFNGFNRKFSIEQNKENLNLGQLNAKATLETAMLSLFNTYYDVARNQLQVQSLEETLNISKERLTRTQYGFEYGRNTRLDLSNAEVDITNDSINFLNAQLALGNAKRNLSLILAEDAQTDFAVDTTLAFAENLDRETLLTELLRGNVQLSLAKSGVTISEYAEQITKARFLPTLSASGSYNTRLGNNNPSSPVAAVATNGISYGLNLNWNLFDGGTAVIAQRNARINRENQKLLLEQTTQQVKLNFENAWADYENKMIAVRSQEKNVETNVLNFDRTVEQYRIGRVTSIDFRTAQSNLLNARINLIQAKYDAKLAELSLFQLVGKIQEANF